MAHIFDPVAELVGISFGIAIKETKEQIEIHPVTLEAKIRKCSI